jgi:hypothetical protein
MNSKLQDTPVFTSGRKRGMTPPQMKRELLPFFVFLSLWRKIVSRYPRFKCQLSYFLSSLLLPLVLIPRKTITLKKRHPPLSIGNLLFYFSFANLTTADRRAYGEILFFTVSIVSLPRFELSLQCNGNQNRRERHHGKTTENI